MVQEVYIHAGAHRTGTSSFQLMLAQNRGLLSTRGIHVVYPGRDGAPKGRLRLKLPGPTTGPRQLRDLTERARKEWARHLGGAEPRVLVSEENIPGRMFHFYRGQFFPSAAERLQLVAESLAAHGVERPRRVTYVIRPYVELFVSAFRKRAEDNPVGTFSDIAPGMVDMHEGWPGLIAKMQTYLAPEELVVLTYPQRGRSVDLLQMVLGTPVPGLEEPERVLNLSATDAALEVLQRRYHAGEKLDRDSWQAVLRTHAGDTASRGFAEFTPAQKKVLDARYERDCARIADMEEVSFLG